ncbi:MAG: hypothetical protein WCG04_04510 [Alphaproteobacteria bacterium]
MLKAPKTDANINKLTELQQKIVVLRQAEQAIQAKIVQQLGHTLQRHDGFNVPATVIIGALIHAIYVHKNTPEKTGDWHEAGAKFLRKCRSAFPQKAHEARTTHQKVAIRINSMEEQDDQN